MEEEINSLETAYKLYRDSLLAGEKLNLDEDDLIDVFDFAGDMSDEFVRLHVILEASHRFPESNGLRLRKAVFLSLLSDEALSDYLNTPEAHKQGQLWAILACRAEMPKGQRADLRLQAIAEMDDDFEEDEAVIQFVALAKHLQRESWLWDNLDYLKKRCAGGLQTLLFEMARLAEGREREQQAIKILEDLTLDHPFYTDYWSLLAELQSNCDLHDDALMSIDYALALAPEDAELYSMKGYILVKAQRYAVAIPVLEKAIKMGASEYSAKRNLIEALRFVDKGSEYRSLLLELQSENPGEQALMLQTICLLGEDIDEVLDRYYDVNGPDTTVLLQHVNELCAENKLPTALRYLEWYKNRFSLPPIPILMLLELYYSAGLYRRAYDLICSELKSFELSGNQLSILCTIASVLIRCGCFEEARDFCERWIDNIDNNVETLAPYKVISRGVSSTLREMVDFLDKNPDPTLEQINQIAL